MQSVTCSHWSPYPSHDIYTTLTDPVKLAAVVKRLQSIEVLDRNEETAEVVTIIDLPGGKVFRTMGHVEGIPGQQIIFRTDLPLKLNIIWEFATEIRDEVEGTAINYTVEVDFAPVAKFISKVMLHGYLSSEMQRDLAKLDEIMSTTSTTKA